MAFSDKRGTYGITLVVLEVEQNETFYILLAGIPGFAQAVDIRLS